MTSGNNNVVIRRAVVADVDAIKQLADCHKAELGFLVRDALLRSIGAQEVFVAEVPIGKLVGFIQFHHRKDTQTTLYNIAVDPQKRTNGIARCLIEALINDSRAHHKLVVRLKCPVDLPANDFYAHLGFTLDYTVSGKLRALNIWKLTL